MCARACVCLLYLWQDEIRCVGYAIKCFTTAATNLFDNTWKSLINNEEKYSSSILEIHRHCSDMYLKTDFLWVTTFSKMYFQIIMCYSFRELCDLRYIFDVYKWDDYDLNMGVARIFYRVLKN